MTGRFCRQDIIIRHAAARPVGSRFHSKDVAKALNFTSKDVGNVLRFSDVVRNVGRHYVKGTIWERV